MFQEGNQTKTLKKNWFNTKGKHRKFGQQKKIKKNRINF